MPTQARKKKMPTSTLRQRFQFPSFLIGYYIFRPAVALVFGRLMRRYYLSVIIKMRQTLILLLSAVVLCNAAIEPANTTISSVPASAGEGSAVTYTDLLVDLTYNGEEDLQTDIYSSFLAINETNAFDTTPSLVAAFVRSFSDGRRYLYLYLDTVDEQGSIHEFEGIVNVEGNDPSIENGTAYNVISLMERTVAAGTVENAIQTPTTLEAFIESLAPGYSKYTLSEIQTDSDLSSVLATVRASYPLVAATSLAAIYFKTEGLASAYLIFYSAPSSSKTSLWKVSAYNNKIDTFIAEFERVPVPASVQN